MVGERLRSIFKPQGEHLAGYKDEIYQGLDLDGAGFLKLPKEIESGLVNDFAKTLTATSIHLKKFVPEVGLIHGWNQPLEGYSQNHEIRDVFADASLDKDYPYGIIRISPFYLKSEFTKRLNHGVREDLEYNIHPFRFLLAHEDFHLWQFLNRYEKTVKDCKVFKTGGFAAWNQTQTEIDANEFANYWIKNHKT